LLFLSTANDELSSSPPNPLEVGPLNPAGGLRSAVSSPSGIWDEAPAADKRFSAYWSQKVQLWWQQLLFIFSFRVLVDKIAAVYFIQKNFSIGNGQPRERCEISQKYYFELDLY